MSNFCECGQGQQNLGVLSCPRLLGSVKKHIRVPLTDDEGVRNSIPTSAFVDGILPDSYILGKLTDSDPSQRWYITPNTYENVEPSRTDSTFDEMSSGASYKVDTGVKVFLGIIPEIDGVIASKMNSGACSAFGNYEIGKDGSLKGEMSADGTELYPIEVSKGSFDATEIEPVEGSTVQRVQVTFQYAKTVNEAQLRIIPVSAIETKLLDVNGMIDGTLTSLSSPSPTATSFSATFVAADFGYYGSTVPLDGQTEPTDWVITDTGLNNIVPSLITNTVEGQYDFTIPSTPGETLTFEFIGVAAKSVDQSYDSNVTTVDTP